MNVVFFELQIYKHKHFSAVYFSLNEKSLVCENVQQRRRWAFIDASPWGSRSDLEVASLVPNFQLVWQLSGGYLVWFFGMPKSFRGARICFGGAGGEVMSSQFEHLKHLFLWRQCLQKVLNWEVWEWGLWGSSVKNADSWAKNAFLARNPFFWNHWNFLSPSWPNTEKTKILCWSCCMAGFGAGPNFGPKLKICYAYITPIFLGRIGPD